jgi:phage terminase Nu1 subunit (DNA packaging protein)
MAEKEAKKISDETEISTTELAVVLGLTARRVQQMAQDGTITPVRRGRFHLCDSVQQYIKFLSKEKDTNPQEKERQDAEISIKKAKAIVAVLEAKELQGKMHRSEDVADMTEDLIYTIRGMLLALPGRLAVDVVNTSTPAEAAEVIRKEVHKVMEEISRYEYDPKKYEERVRERRSWDIEGGDAYGIED